MKPALAAASALARAGLAALACIALLAFAAPGLGADKHDIRDELWPDRRKLFGHYRSATLHDRNECRR